MNKPKWWKDEYKGTLHIGCLNCSTASRTVKMNRKIGVGFGFAGIQKDGDLVWCEHNQEWAELPTLMRFENLARKDPDHDWQCILDTPLHGETFQRHGRNSWVLVDSNEGFA